MTTNRRKFIQTAAASAAAAVVLPGFAASAEQQKGQGGFVLNKNPLKLGLMTYLKILELLVILVLEVV